MLLPSVREIRHLDETRSIRPAADRIKPQGSNDKRVINALRRYGLDRYPVRIDVADDIERVPHLEDDYGYELRISDFEIVIRANSTWGAISACSVLGALAWRSGLLPYCHLLDQPTYAWRGLMIDTSRHFISIQKLKETLELMGCYRLNVLHLNLSNDQACRFSSRAFPRLASTDCYSSEELSDLVRFAGDRGIRVVPELDVPAHTTSWIWAYPEWGAAQLQDPSTGFGVHEACLDPTKPEVIESVKRLFGELAEVFPDSHVHIGGDEVNPTWWERNSRIQAWMASRGMTTAHELQTWFITELGRHVNSIGKQIIGWDEVLADQLPQHFTIQAWRGMSARDTAVEAGHATIVSSPYYLDLSLPANYHYRYYPSIGDAELKDADEQALDDSRLAHVRDGLRWHATFGEFEPVSKREGGIVLGGEACMWSEIADEETLQTRVWSRMPAIAERLWSGKKSLGESEMYARLERSISYWQRKFRVDTLMRSPDELAPTELSPLIQQLEPVKWYARLIGMERVRARTSGQVESTYARPYDTNTPLNRVVDYLSPESLEARRVAAALREVKPITKWCEDWVSQAKAFEGCAARDPRLAELRELSGRLGALASVHLGESPVDMSLAEPVGEYLLPIAMPILHEAIGRIAKRFGARADVVEEITTGHINDTFVIDRTLLVQRINRGVFKVDAVLGNRRMLDEVIHDVVPSVVQTKEGRDHVVGIDGEVWRASEFIEARNFDVLPTELCEVAGRAFGGFLSRLRKCNERPVPVIDGFHDIEKRLTELDALSPTADGRDWLEFVAQRRSTMRTFDRRDFQVIHGDCKVNNILFEVDTAEVARIIDLDTIMWGHPAWDFGDLIRSVLTGAVSVDEQNERIRLTTEGFKKSYRIGAHLRGSFADAPSHMSFMLGVRFLADHFRGDTYFKVDAHGVNLDRAAEQFELSVRLADAVANISEWLVD